MFPIGNKGNNKMDLNPKKLENTILQESLHGSILLYCKKRNIEPKVFMKLLGESVEYLSKVNPQATMKEIVEEIEKRIGK
jgi:hypothetical protein